MMDHTKLEILRYLGRRHQAVPKDISTMVDECLDQMRKTIAPMAIHLTFPLSSQHDGLALAGTDVRLHGRDIARHLNGCQKVVLMAATLGARADILIRQWERIDLTRCLILDACATQLIEAYCDETEQDIRRQAGGCGLMTTRRFSPGYGDLPLKCQPHILNVLNAGTRMGLTCTDSLIMLPRKSVTAIIGLGEDVPTTAGGCDACNRRDTCHYRKGPHSQCMLPNG